MEAQEYWSHSITGELEKCQATFTQINLGISFQLKQEIRGKML